MPTDHSKPGRPERQYTMGALLVWFVLISISLGFARYAILGHGVLSVVALQLVGAALGAPFGYFSGEDRVTGSIFGALFGAAIGMLVALLLMAVLVLRTLQ